MRNHLPSWARCLAGALALLFAPDCTLDDTGLDALDDTDPLTGAESAGVVLSAAVWTFTVDTEGARLSEGRRAEIETDLGYRVTLHTARILSHNVSLTLCDPAAAGSGGGAGQASFGLPIRAARAHTEDADPSLVEVSLVEDLLAPTPTEAGSSFPAGRYCRAHWLVARPLAPTHGPADIPMEGRSLHLAGTFRRDGRARPFTIDTWWPTGLLVDLETATSAASFEAARRDGRPRHAFLTITRHLATLFDGIDFDVATDDQIAGATLDNLVLGADIHVELWSPSSHD